MEQISWGGQDRQEAVGEVDGLRDGGFDSLDEEYPTIPGNERSKSRFTGKRSWKDVPKLTPTRAKGLEKSTGNPQKKAGEINKSIYKTNGLPIPVDEPPKLLQCAAQ